jgi:hypothetical protein
MISSRKYAPLLLARGMRTDQGKGHDMLTFQTPFIAAECYDLVICVVDYKGCK